MRLSILFSALATTVATMCVGCTTIQSADLKTAGMSADFSVTADGTGSASVGAELHVDTNGTDYVDLSPGDTLVASVAGTSQNMSRSSVLGTVHYSASLAGHDGGNEIFTVAFNRTSDKSAPSSTVTLPGAFSISSPSGSPSASRGHGADINVVYSPSGTGDAVTYNMTGDCIRSQSGTPGGDPGSFFINHALIQPLDNVSATKSCTVTISVQKTRSGQIDPAFGAGGSFVAKQTRTVSFVSTP
jgi:hypothetical protein